MADVLEARITRGRTFSVVLRRSDRKERTSKLAEADGRPNSRLMTKILV